RVSGAKNAALPIMCAALLTAEPLRLANVPQLMDVRTMARLLRQMGVEAAPPTGGRLALHARRISDPTAPYDLVKTMRASVLDLGRCLSAMGARIEGAGSDIIRIDGVSSLHGAEHTVMPDRIETGTYLAAAAAAGGHVRVLGAAPDSLDATLEKLREAGARIA